jgi:hypothetical protein
MANPLVKVTPSHQKCEDERRRLQSLCSSSARRIRTFADSPEFAGERLGFGRDRLERVACSDMAQATGC